MNLPRNYPLQRLAFAAPSPPESPSGMPNIIRNPAAVPQTPAAMPLRAAPPPPIQRAVTSPSGSDGYVKFFRHYGLQLYSDQQQLRGQCPFPDCQKEDHFYANYGTGQWDCKRCQRKGNAYTFIEQFHQAALDMTTDEHYYLLGEKRPGIPPWVFKDWKIAVSPTTGEFLLPAWVNDKKLTNLYVWRELYDATKEKYVMTVMSGPTLKHTLYGIHRLSGKRDKPLFILEGHWDTLAFAGLVAYVNCPRTGAPLSQVVEFVGMPGAGVFPKEQLHILDGRDVRVLADNDEAGRSGVERLVRSIAQNNTIPQRFAVVEWPQEVIRGFDVRDLITHGQMLVAVQQPV